jgi:hypothetical protein
MTGLWAFLAAAVLLAAIAYLQIAYARANYPPSRGWRLALFAPLFLLFALIGYFLASGGDNAPAFDVLFGVAIGLIGGLAYTFLFTRRKQQS